MNTYSRCKEEDRDIQHGEEESRPGAVLGERDWKGHRAVV